MASYHAQTSVDPECCQRKCHTICARKDCPASLVPWLKRQHQRLRFIFSPGVNGMFIYSDLLRQIQNTLLILVKFNGIFLMTQGIQGQSLHFHFQLVLLWVWIESDFSNLQRIPMMRSEPTDSLLIDQTDPVIKDLVVILQEFLTMEMNLDSGCGKRAQKNPAKIDKLLQPARMGPDV